MLNIIFLTTCIENPRYIIKRDFLLSFKEIIIPTLKNQEIYVLFLLALLNI